MASIADALKAKNESDRWDRKSLSMVRLANRIIRRRFPVVAGRS